MQIVTGEVAEVIGVPQAALYSYLLDFTRHPEWSSNLSRVRQLTPGAVAVGTRFRTQEGPPPVPTLTQARMMVHFVIGLLSGASPYSEAEITALEDGRLIAWRAGVPRGTGYFNLAEWEVILEPQETATRLVQRFRYLPQVPGAERMVGTAGADGIARACAINLARLKTVAEESLASPAAAARLAPGAPTA